MKLIPNEIKYAEKCLKYNKIDKSRPARSIRVIARYFHLEHKMTLEETLENILGYVQNCEMLHKVSNDFLKEYIPKVLNEGTSMNEIESIHITQEEIDKIENTNYKKSWKKVLFVMLVHYRTKMIWNGTDNYKIENAESEILKDAHVTLSKAKRTEMWRIMEQDGLITFGIGKEAKKITLHYISNLKEYNKTNPIEITDFDDFYIYYVAYDKKQRVKQCQECGNLFLIKRGKQYNGVKYCEKCSKDKQLEHKRNYKNQLLQKVE